MKDYFLRADTREQIDQALQAAGLLIEQNGELIPTAAIDYVGTIYRPTDQVDDEGEPIMAPVEGYHANVRATLTPEQEALLPIIDAPNNPQRIFAGGIL